MPQIYSVYAYSPSLNQEVRQFNLEGTFDTQAVAEQWATAFAYQLSHDDYLRVCDWQARVRLEEVGIHTLVDAMNRA